jgi:uncharacterized protein Yka (UPF0111/DUF47 family)
MVAKTRIIDQLGEGALLIPGQVGAALAANDRVKYRFTLLQAARDHADDPDAPFSRLRAEREASGVEDEDLDHVVAGSRRVEGGGYLIPDASAIHAGIAGDLRTMLAPLEETADESDFAARLEALLARPQPEQDRVPEGYVRGLTHARRGDRDSAHLLVMDMHRALNALQASLAQESVDGAQVYAIDDGDRARVKAFMRGLNATAPLKFDHPGLGTTATRSRGALVIQNDIGTTDAHVLVIRVHELSAVVTYTDIHLRRARFFKSLFESAGVEWEDDRSRTAKGLEESDSYYLCTGRVRAASAAELERSLELIGSRIVFLIDWNKARKRLRQFLRQSDAIGVLKWAADNGFGHRAFLELGGERLIYEALENAGTTHVRYGERLDRVLGRDTVVEHMKFVLRTATEGMLAGRSRQFVRDEVKADLLERLHTAEQGFLVLLGDLAALVVDLAGAVRDGLLAAQAGGGQDELLLTARRAKYWETCADRLVVRVLECMPHAPEREFFQDLAHQADDVADQLEEAAGLMPLLPAVGTPRSLYPPLTRLAERVLESGQRLMSCLESASHVQRGGPREDLHDFLEAVDRILTLERDTDALEREVTLNLVTGDAEHRQLHLLSLIGARLEKAADASARSALMLRDHIMRQVIQG